MRVKVRLENYVPIPINGEWSATRRFFTGNFDSATGLVDVEETEQEKVSGFAIHISGCAVIEYLEPASVGRRLVNPAPKKQEAKQ